MAEISKQALKVENNQSFPNNNNGAITPAILRDFNVDMIDSLVDEQGYNVDSASWNQSIDALEQFTQSINTAFVGTGSFNQFTQSINQYTASNNQKWDTLGALTGSFVTESETGSFARVNVTNTFTQPQIINSAVTASAARIANLNYPTADNGAKSFVQTDGAGNLSLQYVQQVFETIRNMSGVTLQKGTPVYISGSTGDNGNAYIADASDVNKMPAVYIAGETLGVGATGLALLGGKIEGVNTSAYEAGTIVYVAEGGGYTDVRPSGSASVVQVLGVVQKQGVGGQGVIINQLEAVLPNIQTGYAWVGNASNQPVAVATSSFGGGTIDSGSLVTTASFNSYTQSTNVRLNNIESTTASLLVETQNLELFSASALVSISNLNASSASQQISINNLNTTTASLLVETQNLELFSASALTSISNLNQSSASQQVSIDALNVYTASQSTGSLLQTASVNVNVLTFTKADGSTFDLTVAASGSVTPGTISGSAQITALGFVSSSVTASSLITASFDNGTRNLTFTKGDSSTFAVNIPDVSGSAGDFVTTASFNSYTQSNDQRVSSLEVNSASVNTSIGELNLATSSLFTSASLGLTTASISGQTLTFSKGDGTTFGILIPDVSGSTIDTGSFATTGSNNFVGVETINSVAGTSVGEVYLLARSGSLVLGNSTATPTYSALSHLSSSQINANTNLIFKTNTNTADTIISGSGNIFTNPIAPTAGFKRYIGGSNNIFNTTAIPQISGSMQFSPTFTNNYFAGAMNVRGPVSSSAWNIVGNNNNGTIVIGSNATLNAEKLTSGLLMTGNSIAGGLAIIANQSFLTGSSTTFGNNIVNGTATLQLSSSAAAMQNNNINDSNFNLINQFSSQSVGLGQPQANGNFIGGATHTFFVTGSQLGAGFGPAFNQNFVYGNTNTIFINASESRVSGSNIYHSSFATGLMGQRLIVTGSSNTADGNSYGSMFVGRWNADDGIRNKTSDIVFAVGTGTSGSAGIGRKTGFLVDSGSNTFVEGTLNVSGATSLNGDLVITGSLTASLQQGYVWVGNASGITTTVATSSFGGGSTDTGSLMVTGSVLGNVLTFTKGDASTFSLTVATGSGGGGVTFPYSGSVEITGSVKVKPFTLSVTSQTASIDMNESNYFILNLPTSSTTHIAFTNIIPGESINLLVSQSATVATGSIAFAPNIYFPNGSDYQATATGSARDIVSFITFNTNEIYGTQIKNLY